MGVDIELEHLKSEAELDGLAEEMLLRWCLGDKTDSSFGRRIRVQVGDSSTLPGVQGYHIERDGQGGGRFTLEVLGCRQGRTDRSTRSSVDLGEKQQAILEGVLNPVVGGEAMPLIFNFWNRLKTRYIASVYLENPRVQERNMSYASWGKEDERSKYPTHVLLGVCDRLNVAIGQGCATFWLSAWEGKQAYRWKESESKRSINRILNVQIVDNIDGVRIARSVPPDSYEMHQDGEGMTLKSDDVGKEIHSGLLVSVLFVSHAEAQGYWL